MRHPANHIFEHTPDSLRAWCEQQGMPAFRAKQILEWVYAKGVIDPARMSNLSARDRDTLARGMTFLSGETVAHQRATDDTQKLLIEWSDGDPAPRHLEEQGGDARRSGAALTVLSTDTNIYTSLGSDPSRQTECVMIPTDDRRTACISSQVGCPVGCRFCASGLGGLDANLSAGRIVEQVWRLARLEGVGRITNVVFMGMGEPLANFQPVKRAVETLAAPWGMAISARKITVSTVGLPQAIEKLAANLDLPVTLALSLHAPTDELRRELIPWSQYTTIADLLAACDTWFRKTGREITLEYILLGGVNDRPEHAEALAKLAKRLRSNVNLIRYNEVAGLPYTRPATEDVRAFQQILRDRGVNAHIRASRGRDIAAACGQLRHEKTGAA
ncbi:MAG: 23S rRNA (adenine(2503)-C(2))-methyltransferase RlmN [Planctomycetota bacterium]|nr:23S rRNA (adenine(2503)-C(2))-methyltransferase RlmN [Planctomycetota bacterium]